jgi:hypothetical protein
MEAGCIRLLFTRALLLSVVVAFSGCDQSMELQDISQCISAIPEGSGLSTVPPGGLKSIPERECFGLQWSIPLAYEPYVFGTPVENLNITMGLLDQTPGAHMTEARKLREQPQISIYPQLNNEFQERVASLRKAAEDAYGLTSTGTLLYGMEVLMSNVTRGARVIMFYPLDQGQPMVVCTIGVALATEQPIQQLIEQIDPSTLCSVTSYINGWLFAEYHIVYSLMPQFELINSVLMNNILEFRVP